MLSLAQRLIAEERRAGNQTVTASRAAFRVCERLRRPLSTFAGAGGFRSLLSRALALAKAEAPILGDLQIKADGTLEFSPELAAQLENDQALAAGVALTSHLLGLLVNFIGEALTLRLILDVWPKEPLKDSNSGEK